MKERQCWAYGPNGRCTHPAGHPGNHIIEYTWTDDECVTPTVPTLAHSASSAPRVQMLGKFNPATFEELDPPPRSPGYLDAYGGTAHLHARITTR